MNNFQTLDDTIAIADRPQDLQLHFKDQATYYEIDVVDFNGSVETKYVAVINDQTHKLDCFLGKMDYANAKFVHKPPSDSDLFIHNLFMTCTGSSRLVSEVRRYQTPETFSNRKIQA